ncbi:MAG: hypothetical protein Kow0068_13970 [Marinilabiliales bacterium]
MKIKKSEFIINFFYIIIFLNILILIPHETSIIDFNKKLYNSLIFVLGIGTFLGIGYRSFLIGNKRKFKIYFYYVILVGLILYIFILLLNLII